MVRKKDQGVGIVPISVSLLTFHPLLMLFLVLAMGDLEAASAYSD
jgi:hypothetical protein